MSATASLLAILGALLLGAVSPGPSFILVCRLSVARSRAAGLAAALGMGVGGAVFAGLALAGLAALLDRVAILSTLLRIGGGLYLLWLGWRIFRSAAAPLAVGGDALADRHGFWLALATQLSNPKTALAYAGIFAALLPPAPPAWFLLALPPLVLAVEAGWYALVALAFSAPAPRAAYLRGKAWLDRAAGLVMAGLGLRLLLPR